MEVPFVVIFIVLSLDVGQETISKTKHWKICNSVSPEVLIYKFAFEAATCPELEGF